MTCPCTCHGGDAGRYDCSRMAAVGGCACREVVREEPTEPDRTSGPTYRCRRGLRCADRQPVRDPDTRELTGWEPATARLRGDRDGLCTACHGRLDAALAVLPRLADALDRMIGRDATAAPLTGVPTSGSKEPPIPLRGHVEAVRALLQHTVAQWAARVGADVDDTALLEDLGDDPWTAYGPRRALPWADAEPGDLAHRARHGDVASGLLWLQSHTLSLVSLGPEQMPVWSLGEHPADDHGGLDVTVGPGRHGTGQLFWADQDGVDAATTLIDLEIAARRVTGGTVPRQTSSVGCTRCSFPTTYRLPGAHAFTCPRCGFERPEADHDVLMAHLVTSRPESPGPAKARHRKERADSAARAARLAAGRNRHRR